MKGTVALTAGLALVTAAVPALADDLSDIESLLEERVITTASTSAENASAAPALSTTLTAEDIRLHGILTLAEALDFLSLGVVTGNPLRTPDIGSRGVLFTGDEGRHFLLLINGHLVNDPLYGAARFDEGAGVPLDMVDRIEVVVGPGSVLYGSNAMMGVVNVITKDARSYRGGHLSARYEPGAYGGATAGTGFTFDLLGTPSEVTLGVDYTRRFGPSFAFGRQDLAPALLAPLSRDFGTGEDNVWGGGDTRPYTTEVPSAILRLRVGEVQASVMASSFRRSIPYATESLPLTFDDPTNSELERALRFDVVHQSTLTGLVHLYSRVYADGFDYQRRAVVPGLSCLFPVSQCEYYDAGRTRWVGLEERVSLNWLRDQSLVTLLGIDVRQRGVSAKQDLSDADTGAYLAPTVGNVDEDSLLVAPYVQQTYSPTSFLDLNAGARLDADDRFRPVLSPRSAVALRPFEKTTVKAIYSQAFRAPTHSEMDLANRLVAPSDPEPETVRSVEGSVEQRFGAQRVLFGVFHTSWDRLIEATALSPAEQARLQAEGRIPLVVGSTLAQSRNVSSIENFGYNGGLDGSFVSTRLRYGLGVTAARTRVSDAGSESLAAAPRLFGNARISYAAGGHVPTPALAVSYVGRRDADRLAPTGELLPSAPPMARLRFTLSGTVPVLKGLGYSATTEYATADSGPYGAGPSLPRVFILGREGLAPRPEAAPIDAFRFFFALRYDFLTEQAAQTEAVP